MIEAVRQARTRPRRPGRSGPAAPREGTDDEPHRTAATRRGRARGPRRARTAARGTRAGHQHEAHTGPLGDRAAGADDLVPAARPRGAVPWGARHPAVRPRHLRRERLPDLLDVLPPHPGRCRRGPGGAGAGRARAGRGPVRRPARPRLQRGVRPALPPPGRVPDAGGDRRPHRVRRADAGDQRLQQRPARRPRRVPRALPSPAPHPFAAMKRFEGSVVFVTGAAHGQGRAAALAFAREGASVSALDVARPLDYPGYAMGTGEELASLRAECEALGTTCLTFAADVRDGGAVARAVDETVARLGAVDVLFNNAGICGYGLAHELSEAAWDAMIDVNLKGTWVVASKVIPHMIRRRSGVIVNNCPVAGLRGMGRLSHYAASKWVEPEDVAEAVLFLASEDRKST